MPDGPPARFSWRRTMHHVVRSRRSGAHRNGMVAGRPRQPAHARLFPRRKPGRTSRLALPRRVSTAARLPTFCMGICMSRRLRVERLKADPLSAYAELAVTTNFSFLRGASMPKNWSCAPGSLALSASASPTATGLPASCGAHHNREGHRLPGSRSVPVSCSATARPTSSPIREIARPGAVSRAC